ncbi:MAG: hypothetical protein NXI04_27960 [Planctomycetaceae bacterium]|nr:hypothetical protein [Planctomycetaceae bacterium]
MKLPALLTLLAIPAVLFAQSSRQSTQPATTFDFSFPVQTTTSPAANPFTPATPGQAANVPQARIGYPLPSSASSFYGNLRGRVSKEEHALNQKIAAATKGLRSSDADEQTEAEASLQNALEELFDVRTGSREKEIKDLEVRLQRLRDQLEARQEKKREIVKLRLQTIVNEANGLSL